MGKDWVVLESNWLNAHMGLTLSVVVFRPWPNKENFLWSPFLLSIHLHSLMKTVWMRTRICYPRMYSEFSTCINSKLSVTLHQFPFHANCRICPNHPFSTLLNIRIKTLSFALLLFSECPVTCWGTTFCFAKNFDNSSYSYFHAFTD